MPMRRLIKLLWLQQETISVRYIFMKNKLFNYLSPKKEIIEHNWELDTSIQHRGIFWRNSHVFSNLSQFC